MKPTRHTPEQMVRKLRDPDRLKRLLDQQLRELVESQPPMDRPHGHVADAQ
jgi:hypothetical protein